MSAPKSPKSNNSTSIDLPGAVDCNKQTTFGGIKKMMGSLKRYKSRRDKDGETKGEIKTQHRLSKEEEIVDEENNDEVEEVEEGDLSIGRYSVDYDESDYEKRDGKRESKGSEMVCGSPRTSERLAEAYMSLLDEHPARMEGGFRTAREVVKDIPVKRSTSTSTSPYGIVKKPFDVETSTTVTTWSGIVSKALQPEGNPGKAKESQSGLGTLSEEGAEKAGGRVGRAMTGGKTKEMVQTFEKLAKSQEERPKGYINYNL